MLSQIQDNKLKIVLDNFSKLTNIKWSPWVMMGNYRRVHAPDQLALAVPVYRVSDRSNALSVSS